MPEPDNWLPSSDNWLTESDNCLPESDNCAGNTVVVAVQVYTVPKHLYGGSCNSTVIGPTKYCIKVLLKLDSSVM